MESQNAEFLDEDAIKNVAIRWSLALEYLANATFDSLAHENAIQILLKRDVPMLISELIRLRPELA